MRKYILSIIIIIVVIGLGTFISRYNTQNNQEKTEPEQETETNNNKDIADQEEKEIPKEEEKKEEELKENPEDVAKDWVKNNSSTYRFDGMDLKLLEIRGLDLADCENCYEVEFGFNSSHTGYGDREGQMLAQVITPHVIVITVKNGKAAKAITDQKYDEIKQEFVDN